MNELRTEFIGRMFPGEVVREEEWGTMFMLMDNGRWVVLNASYAADKGDTYDVLPDMFLTKVSARVTYESTLGVIINSEETE